MTVNTNTTNCYAGIEPRRRTFQAEGIQLSYLEWGSNGPPLLLLHGITSSARGWWRVAPALVGLGYHVYAMDMPGHGLSDTTEHHEIDRIAALVDVLLSTPELAGATLIGHSWGGAVSLVLASTASRRSRPSRVVLVDPALRMSPSWGADRLPFYLAGVGEPLEQTLPVVRAANPGWHDCDVFWKGEALQQCRPEAVRGLFLYSGEWDLAARLAQVEMPLLLLVADPQYTVIAPETLDAARAALRADLGQVVVLHGTDHNIQRAGFDSFMRVLSAWLGETARPSSE